MNICITPESVKLFASYFKKQLPSQFTNKITATALLNKMFDEALSNFKNTGLNDVRNKELILQHLSILPQVVKQYMGETPSANNPELLAGMNEWSQKIYEASQADSPKAFQDVIAELGRVLGTTKVVAPVERDMRFEAVSFELFKTVNQEMIYEEGVGYSNNITDPTKEFEFAVQRAIIQNGNKNNLQFKVVSQSELNSLSGINNTLNNANPELLVLVPITSSGEIAKFDETGNLATEGKTPVYAFKQNRAEFDYLAKTKTGVYISQGMTAEAASLKVEQEINGYLDIVNDLIQKHKAGETAKVNIDLNASSMGFVESNIHNKTALSEISNVNDLNLSIEQTEKNWYPVIYAPVSGNALGAAAKNILFEKSLEDISDEELNILTELITDPKLKIEGWKGTIKSEKRRALIYYFHQQSANFEYQIKTVRDDKTGKFSKEYFMKIGNSVIEINSENKELIKQTLKDYFTTRTSKPYLYSSKFTNISPFASLEATTDTDQVFVKADGTYAVTTAPKRNMNIERTTDLSAEFDFPISVKDGVITLSKKTHKQHIIENTKTSFVPNSNMEIRGFGSYLALTPELDYIADVETPDEEVLFKTVAEQNLENKPTAAQEQKVEEWIKSNPLAKELAINYFDEIHEKGPSFLGEYIKGAINMYLGSNKTDVYHEVFHAFTQAVLTKEEREALYAEVKKTPGKFSVIVKGVKKTIAFSDASDLEIEEYLAERFQDFAASKGKLSSKYSTRVGQFFEKVWNLLKGMFGASMTYNEAVALNQANGVVNAMFNALYEGNIDISKFNPQASSELLFKSSEISTPDTNFSLEEVQVSMESFNSLISEFINYGINANTNRATNLKVVKLLIESSTVKLDSKKHAQIMSEIDKLNKTAGTINGYGVFAVANNPAVLTYALTYVKNRLTQQRDLLKPKKGETPSFAYNTLSKVLDNFGSIENALDYLGTDTNTNMIGLYLNNYSTINVTNPEFDLTDEMNDEERFQFLFDRTGTEKSLAELTDAQTKQLLSSIHAYSNNGKGTLLVNSLGIKKLQPFAQMLAKTSKILRNTTDRVEMYHKLVKAAETDYEIKQILLKLGDLTNPKISTEEQKQWLAFWQVMNKSDLILREFILEKKVNDQKQVTYEARSGRSKSQTQRIASDWGDNFVFVSQTNDNYGYNADRGVHFLLPTDLALEYAEKGFGLISGNGPAFITNKDEAAAGTKYTRLTYKAVAKPFEFLRNLGIDLVEDEVVADILINGNASLGIEPGIINNILESMLNRENAVKESDRVVYSLKDLFTDFSYREEGSTETKKQIGLNGWFKQLQELQFMFSDENAGFMGVNASGDKQSEKSLNSSLTIMINALNNASSYDELIKVPGLEMFDVDNNPFAAASPWLINMFNLESKDPGVYGTRNKNFKITAENLSGSKIIFETEDKGISAISSDEKTKFISDFHLTLEGKQEILRSEAKSTSLTVHAPVKRNGVILKNELVFTKVDVEKIFTEAYDKNEKSTILYDQFYRHLEAELVRITRLNAIVDAINNGEEVEFDAAYLERGRSLYMFDDILESDPSLKDKLLKLGVEDSFTLNSILDAKTKKKIDLALKTYFEKKSESLFNEKNDQLTIADNVFAQYVNENQTVEQTRKKMFKTFVLNNFIENANYSTLFIGDASLYKVEGEDYHKRIAGLISTGNIFASDSSFLNFVNDPAFNNFGFAKKHNGEGYKRDYTGYLNTAVIKEKETSSAYLQQLKDIIGIDAESYGDGDMMKEADGAGWISFDAYRLMNLSCNEWSDAQEALYQKMLTGETIAQSDIKSTFPVRKFQYYGSVNNNNSKQFGLQMMAFHKYSLMPLIPALIENTPLKKLHDQMMEQGIDYVTMQSGSKVSSISKVVKADTESGFKAEFDNVYDEKRNLNSVAFTVNRISSKYLKNQIFIAAGYKKKITLPTQKRKMIVLGLMDNFGPTDFMPNLSDAERLQKWEALKSESQRRQASKNYDWYKRYEIVISKIQAHLKNELLEDIGLKLENGKYVGDSSKLVSYLQAQMKNNDLLPEDIEFITTPDGKLKSDLSLSMYSEKIESILTTLADKKLRALKVTGEALVQVPGTMFEDSTKASAFANLQNPTAADIYNYGSNGLKFYHVVDENGDPVLNENKSWIVKAMEVKISLQGDFKKLLYLNHFDGDPIAVYTETKDGKKELDLEACRLRLNEAIRNPQWNKDHEQFLQIAGDRIPSQGPNALESITVAEFLPEWAGPIVILPAEIVAKAGSDYDIDKLFAQFPNIVKIGKKVELQKYMGDVTTPIEELYESKESIADVISRLQDSISELYEDRNKFWEESNAISAEIKAQIQKEQGLEKNLFETRKELYGYLNAAQKGIWKFADISSKNRVPFIEQYTDQINTVNNLIEIQEQAIKDRMYKELGAELAVDFFNYNKSKIDELQKQLDVKNEELESVQRKIYGKSIKGLENELLGLFAERILLPGNIKDLVTANSTKTALPISKKIADKLNASKSGSKYSKYDRANGKAGKKISKSTIFDYRYNLLKHQENSVGLDSLGIAAVTATFYAVFTTFGAKLNAVSPKEQEAFDKALATLNDASASPKAKETATDIINKFRSHTFNLNHNSVEGEFGKQIALGFINNTKNQSISDLLSQLINGYVDVAKDAWVFNMQGNKENTPTLLFMVMAGVDLESAAYLASSPLVMEYNQFKKELNGVYSALSTDPDVNPVVPASKINSKAQAMVFEKYKDLFAENGYEAAAFNAIFNKNQTPFSEEELFNMIGGKPGFREIEALAEYIQIEKIANDVSKFQQLSRFDTNKVSSISEAQKRIDDIEAYQSKKKYVPNDWFTDKGIKNTPVGQFNNDQFIVDLFERYFSFRNNPAVVKVSVSLDTVKGIIPEVMRNDFKNDFLFFLYQNSLYQDNKYNGYDLVTSTDANAPLSIDEDTKTITFGSNLYSNELQNPAAGLTNVVSNFATPNQFLRYYIEFEKLKDIDVSELRSQYYFLDNPRKPVSDLYLKQKIALYKSRNHIAYFSGPTSVANIFKNFRLKYPELAKEFSLINDMRFNYDVPNMKSNMFLPEINDPQMRAKYKENLANLQNHSAPEVREFFNLFNHIAIMQTGLNRRSKYDLGKIIDANHLQDVIENGIGVARVENELAQVFDNIKAAELNNRNPNNAPIEPDLQLLGQFKTLFENMLATKYKVRAKGYNYEVQKLTWGQSKEKSETVLAFNNVDIRTNFNSLPKGVSPVTVDLFFDEDGEYTPEEFANELEGKKIAILNERMIVPAGEDQKKFDALLLDKFGIDNTGTYPKLEYKSKFKKEGFLSIAGLGTELKPIHSVKDEAMANASTVAIGKATVLNPKYKSSTEMYINEINRTEPNKLATSKTKFKFADSVWIFGSGVFANAYRNTTLEEFQKALNETFESYHKPLIQKAIDAGVKVFNVGTASGIDQMAIEYLENSGFVKVPVYTAVGKYYEMRRKDAESEVSTVTTSEELKGKELISYLFDSNKSDNWFNKLTEVELFESGVGIVYDKIVKELNRNQKYKIQFANALAASKGKITIGNSLLASYIEQALYKMKDDIIKFRANKVKAPIIVEAIGETEQKRSEELFSSYTGTLSKAEFLSLSLVEQEEIIEQQNNC